MTAQVPDLFEWEGKAVPVHGGCPLPVPHPDIVPCRTWWTPDSGRVVDEVVRSLRQKHFNEQTAAENRRRRAASLPEVTAPIASKYMENATDCRRGYIATFAVRDGELVLVFIQGNHGLRNGQPVKVAYTGRFALGTGVNLDFVEGRLESVTRVTA